MVVCGQVLVLVQGLLGSKTWHPPCRSVGKSGDGEVIGGGGGGGEWLWWWWFWWWWWWWWFW